MVGWEVIMIVKMMLEMPSSFLVEENGHPIQDIVSITYPNLLDLFGNVECFKDKMILAPPLEVINSVNVYVMSLFLSEDRVYLSFDSM